MTPTEAMDQDRPAIGSLAAGRTGIHVTVGQQRTWPSPATMPAGSASRAVGSGPRPIAACPAAVQVTRMTAMAPNAISLAVGEIGETEDAVDQGDAECAQGELRSRRPWPARSTKLANSTSALTRIGHRSASRGTSGGSSGFASRAPCPLSVWRFSAVHQHKTACPRFPGPGGRSAQPSGWRCRSSRPPRMRSNSSSMTIGETPAVGSSSISNLRLVSSVPCPIGHLLALAARQFPRRSGGAFLSGPGTAR